MRVKAIKNDRAMWAQVADDGSYVCLVESPGQASDMKVTDATYWMDLLAHLFGCTTVGLED